MIDPAEAQRLETALTALGLHYAMHTSADNVYAGFRMSSPDGKSLHHTANIQDGVLQVSARELARLSMDSSVLDRLNKLNRQWRLGRLQLDIAGELTAVVGCYIGVDVPSRCLDDALFVLHDAVASMASFDTWEAPDRGQLLPTNDSPLTAIYIESILRDLGLAFTEHENSIDVAIATEDSSAKTLLINLTMIDLSTMRLQATSILPPTLIDSSRALGIIRRINTRVGIGALLVDDDMINAHYRVHLPRQWLRINAQTLSWHFDRAVGVLSALERHSKA
jgi:hypothetical protein